jgi:hypothetical protein
MDKHSSSDQVDASQNGQRREERRWFNKLSIGVAATIGGGFLLRQRALGAPEAPGYPKPSYLPAGYRLLGEYQQPVDGFGDDPSQIAYSYTKRTNVPLYPLRIVLSKRPTQGFFGTVDRSPTQSLLLNGTVQAKYYDGMWSPTGANVSDPRSVPMETLRYWNTTNEHVIVFTLGDFAIGIRGCRAADVSFDELVKIAAGMR